MGGVVVERYVGSGEGVSKGMGWHLLTNVELHINVDCGNSKCWSIAVGKKDDLCNSIIPEDFETPLFSWLHNPVWLEIQWVYAVQGNRGLMANLQE